MPTVEFRKASRIYDPKRPPAVNTIDLRIEDGEFLVLVGPSGCGKSTTLRMLAGLEPIDEGQILIDGKDVTHMRARDRDVAMVFQSYALYPNMTARQNMAFALENQKLDKALIAERVAMATQMLQLEDIIDKKPSQMSGGQRQRVAMGRAIVRQPKVFLMDEPLSNLDAKLRVSTRAQIATLQRNLGTTTVYVTHDQTEAMTLGDRVCVLRHGIVQQVDTPQTLYDEPGNTFVASFIGSPSITLIDDVPQRGTSLSLDGQHFAELGLSASQAEKLQTDHVIVGVRPENWEIIDDHTTAEVPSHGACIAVRVDVVDNLGSEQFAHCSPVGKPGVIPSDASSDGPRVRHGRITVRAQKGQLSHGEHIVVRPIAGAAVFFDPQTEINLNYLGNGNA